MLCPACGEVVLRAEEAGDMVHLVIEDEGPGIVDSVLKRLFEPLVTSKPNGMGVGLSISHSIIKSHGGELRAEPNPEGGTIFSFTLPQASVSKSGRDKDQRRVA